jgi:hypothetical protein
VNLSPGRFVPISAWLRTRLILDRSRLHRKAPAVGEEQAAAERLEEEPGVVGEEPAVRGEERSAAAVAPVEAPVGTMATEAEPATSERVGMLRAVVGPADSMVPAHRQGAAAISPRNHTCRPAKTRTINPAASSLTFRIAAWKISPSCICWLKVLVALSS